MICNKYKFNSLALQLPAAPGPLLHWEENVNSSLLPEHMKISEYELRNME